MPSPRLAMLAAVAAVATVLLAACGAPPDAPAPAMPASPAGGTPSSGARVGSLPASWAGELRAASGSVRWQLDLLPPDRFQLRQTFVTRAAPNAFDDIGRFAIEGARLTLRGGRESPLFLALRADGDLELLDGDGRPIVSAVARRLQRLPAPAPIEPRLTLAGMFSYWADAPRFVLCADGRSLPVQMAADYLALERAYLAARPAPGAPMLAQLDGLIALRPSAEGSQPPQPTLVVERFGRLLPGASCEHSAPDRPLIGTGWRLVWMGGQVFTPAQAAQPPQLRFDGARVSGSDGCNRLAGPYTADGTALRLGPLVGTRMACMAGMAEAQAFADALHRVRQHAVRGDLLELLDEGGALLLRLQAD